MLRVKDRRSHSAYTCEKNVTDHGAPDPSDLDQLILQRCGYPLTYEGRTYHFHSEIDRWWIFQTDPKRYRDHMSIVDRLVSGAIQPPPLEGVLKYMNIAPGECGDDAHQLKWAEAFRVPRNKAA